MKPKAHPLTIVLLVSASALALGASGASDWLNITGRADSDIKLDTDRKPVETLRFLGIRRGDRVLDYMAGGGYYAEIMAQAVGRRGQVTAWNPVSLASSERSKQKWQELTARTPNLTHTVAPFDQFEAPANSYTFTLFHLTYHDLYWQSEQYNIPRTDPDAVLRRLFAAMRPGGIVGVVDHMGSAGDTRAIVDKLHRIDPAVIKADFARAGFRLAAESDHLRSNSDDYSKGVFDPALRGKTDRIAYRFIKPRR